MLRLQWHGDGDGCSLARCGFQVKDAAKFFEPARHVLQAIAFVIHLLRIKAMSIINDGDSQNLLIRRNRQQHLICSRMLENIAHGLFNDEQQMMPHLRS